MSLTALSDDPDKLLNEWLGELENLIGVSSLPFFSFLPFLLLLSIFMFNFRVT